MGLRSPCARTSLRQKRQPNSPTIVSLHTYPYFVYLLNHRPVIPYISEDQAEAATKNPNLKLLFRLSKFYILDEGERVIGFG